jgi:hypothetical protein
VGALEVRPGAEGLAQELEDVGVRLALLAGRLAGSADGLGPGRLGLALASCEDAWRHGLRSLADDTRAGSAQLRAALARYAAVEHAVTRAAA